MHTLRRPAGHLVAGVLVVLGATAGCTAGTPGSTPPPPTASTPAPAASTPAPIAATSGGTPARTGVPASSTAPATPTPSASTAAPATRTPTPARPTMTATSTTTGVRTPAPRASTTGPASASVAPLSTTLWLNARYGFAVPYPSLWRVRESDNGDGAIIDSADGRSRLVVNGSNNEQRLSAANALSGAKQALLADGWTVSTTALGTGTATLTGVRGSERHFERLWVGAGSINRLQLDYPGSQRQIGDYLAAAVAGFRPGDLTRPH